MTLWTAFVHGAQDTAAWLIVVLTVSGGLLIYFTLIHGWVPLGPLERPAKGPKP